MGFLSPAESLAMADAGPGWGIPFFIVGCLVAFTFLFAAGSLFNENYNDPDDRKFSARVALLCIFVGPFLVLYWPAIGVIGGVSLFVILVRVAVKG